MPVKPKPDRCVYSLALTAEQTYKVELIRRAWGLPSKAAVINKLINDVQVGRETSTGE